MSKGSDSELSVRAGFVLKSLIETHIADGLPVGSRTLACLPGLKVSAATVRNIMHDLEAAGYIAAPHTSAGRIPTAAGYRFFVDSLLEVAPLTGDVIGQYKAQFDEVSGSQDLIHSASSMLSGITQLAGLVSLPKADSAVLQQVEFLKLSATRVLAVLVMSNGDVQNRVLELNRDYIKSELERVGNYLTQHFAGMNLRDARARLAQDLEALQRDMNVLMAAVVDLGGQALDGDEDEEPGLVVEGQTHLMDYAELSNIEKLRQLFDAFNEKGEILHVLERCESANALQIYIGQEAGPSVLGDCSVVTAPYSVNGDIVGVLGVIGPTRMAYDRVIPIVDVTAKLLGAALNSR